MNELSAVITKAVCALEAAMWLSHQRRVHVPLRDRARLRYLGEDTESTTKNDH